MSEDLPFRQLMDQLKAGDQDAATAVFHKYSRRLMALAARKLPRPVRAKEDEDEVVNSAMKSFYVRQKKGEFKLESWDDLSTLLSYLTVCKVNHRIRKYLTDMRDIRRETVGAEDEGEDSRGIDPPAPDPTPAEAAVAAEMLEKIRAKLDPINQQIFTLCLEQYTRAEIAEEVGMSERTVFRVIKKLRAHLLERLGPEAPEVGRRLAPARPGM